MNTADRLAAVHAAEQRQLNIAAALVGWCSHDQNPEVRELVARWHVEQGRIAAALVGGAA